MWKAPGSVKHPLPDPGWPTAAQAERARWFAPLVAGRVSLATRTWVPAMVPWRASDEGEVTDAVVDWYARFARGRPGALVVEATGIRDVPSGPLLRAGEDRFVPGLRRVVEAARAASGGETRLFVQLIDFLALRRRPEPGKFFQRHLALTAAHRAAGPPGATDAELRAWLEAAGPAGWATLLGPDEREALEHGARQRVTDVHVPEVAELPRRLPALFAAAAARCEAAGFDGVELHAAHAYTLASFLSRTNTRADGWGATPEGRRRVVLEVLAAVRGAVGPRFVVGARLLTDECIEGGSTVDDAVGHALALGHAGLDFLSLSRGGKFDDARQPAVGWAAYPYTGRSGWECMPTVYALEPPFGRNLADAGTVRAALRQAGLGLPVIGGGAVTGFAQAEAALAAGQVDAVATARQALADPDWFLKVRAGRGAEVRRCELTNYCEGLDQKHKVVTCKLWDRLALDEPGVARTADGKRRLVAPAWAR